MAAQIVAHQVWRIGVAGFDQDAVAVGDVGEDVGDIRRRGRGDAVGGVAGFLLLAAAVGFVERALHGDPVGVEDHPALYVARGAADGLDQAGFGAQEVLVGIEDRDQAAFGGC